MGKLTPTKNFYLLLLHKKEIREKCSQEGYITSEELDKQIDEELAKYTILPQFKDWVLEIQKGYFSLREVLTGTEPEKPLRQKTISDFSSLRSFARPSG